MGLKGVVWKYVSYKGGWNGGIRGLEWGYKGVGMGYKGV